MLEPVQPVGAKAVQHYPPSRNTGVSPHAKLNGVNGLLVNWLPCLDPNGQWPRLQKTLATSDVKSHTVQFPTPELSHWHEQSHPINPQMLSFQVSVRGWQTFLPTPTRVFFAANPPLRFGKCVKQVFGVAVLFEVSRIAPCMYLVSHSISQCGHPRNDGINQPVVEVNFVPVRNNGQLTTAARGFVPIP